MALIRVEEEATILVDALPYLDDEYVWWKVALVA
jgi:hypothetical protein